MYQMEHIEENLIDQYAMGSLAGDVIAQIEEHLLCCPVCQRKLLAADEFLTAFRPAAADVDTYVTAGWVPRLRLSRGLWAAAAAVCGLLIFIATEDIRKPKLSPVIVSMQSMRGPESTQQISAGRASRLV